VSRAGPDPGPRARALHLFALFAFALAQPILDLVARNAELLVARRAGRAEIACLLAALLVAPPLAGWLVEAAASLAHPALARGLHLALVGLLSAATLLPPLARIPTLPGALALALAGAAGAAAAWLYARRAGARAFASLLAGAPLVFAAAFLLHPAIGKLVLEPALPPSAPLGLAGETPVVLLVFDELPTSSLLGASGGIDAVRYPAFARLARESTWFRNASTVHAFTRHAVPAILTGLRPDLERLPIASDHPRNLMSLLGHDYAIHASETFTYLHRPLGEAHPWSRRFALLRLLLPELGRLHLAALAPRDLAPGLGPGDGDWSQLAAARFDMPAGDLALAHRGRVERVRAWIAGISARHPRTLHVLHENLPHRPWHFLPSGRRYHPTTHFGLRMEGDTHEWQDEEWWVVQGYQRHLLQLGLVDALLGELLARLDAEGLAERALLVVTADHGASFRAGESHRDPARMSHPEDAFAVPLFVKLPGQRDGRVDLRNAETVDVLPTIADALGAALPWPVDGCSLLAGDCPPRAVKTVGTRGMRRLRYDPALGLRTDTLARKLALFGEGGPGDRLFAPGPWGALVGRAAAELRGEPASGRAILMREPFEEAAKSPETSTLARITAALQPPPPAPVQLHAAVAVRGRVEAVAPVLPDGRGGAFFSVLLPEERSPGGPGDLEILLVEGTPPSARLRPLRLAPLRIGGGLAR
jgi:hypothetical protein